MRPLNIYIETSVFNFYFSEQDEEKKQHTLKLFEEIKEGKYVPHTSAYVAGELANAPEPKKSQMLGLITNYGMKVLPVDPESERLAGVYVDEGIIPDKYRTDGIHIAVTAVSGLDFIVSYNFNHIVKRKTIEMTEIINFREGHKRVGIYSPTEVIENDE
jgi:hypothetical protein